MNESEDEIKNNFYMFPKDAEGLPVTYFLFFLWHLLLATYAKDTLNSDLTSLLELSQRSRSSLDS